MEILINYWAVLVAALANMVVGSLWYGPIFGKMWMSYTGITQDSMKDMPLTVWQAMVGGLITSLLMAFVLAHVIAMSVLTLGDKGLVTGLTSAFFVWLGFTATTLAGSYLWEGKPLGLFVLNAAQSLVALVAMALIIAAWPS